MFWFRDAAVTNHILWNFLLVSNWESLWRRADAAITAWGKRVSWVGVFQLHWGLNICRGCWYIIQEKFSLHSTELACRGEMFILNNVVTHACSTPHRRSDWIRIIFVSTDHCIVSILCFFRPGWVVDVLCLCFLWDDVWTLFRLFVLFSVLCDWLCLVETWKTLKIRLQEPNSCLFTRLRSYFRTYEYISYLHYSHRRSDFFWFLCDDSLLWKCGTLKIRFQAKFLPIYYLLPVLFFQYSVRLRWLK